jgi:hypothetical protein
VHLATVMMEGSSPLQQRVLNFVYEHYPNGQQVFEMARCIAACIREEDLELQVCSVYVYVDVYAYIYVFPLEVLLHA